MKTIGELRKSRNGLDDNMVETGCTEAEALMIDGYAEEDQEGPVSEPRQIHDGSNACQCGCRCRCSGPHRSGDPDPACPLR